MWKHEALKRRIALLGILALVGLIGFGPPALAQETEEPAAEEQPVPETPEGEVDEGAEVFDETVTVTGSLIPRADLNALSPVTVLEVENELRYSGVTRMEDLVVSLPQVFAGQNSTIANGASGTATIDLRNLGVPRTLVLVNGRRMAGGEGWQGTGTYGVDINAIPAAIVKRVDVLTGGASTTYGADAVAGVVNFVMDTEFQGVRAGFQYSGYQHDNNNALAQSISSDAIGFPIPTGSGFDGDGLNAYFALGGKFAEGKGHAVMYGSYRELDELTKGARDYVHCAVGAGDDGPACIGSSTVPQGRYIAFNADGTLNGDFVRNGDTLQPRSGETFNFGPYNHLQRPDEKFAVGAFGHYTINEHFEPYAEVMFTSDHTDAQIAFTGTFGETNRVLNCDNPLLSDQQRNALCGPGTGYGPTDNVDVLILKRGVEGQPRSNALNHDNLRMVAGVRGDINDQWSWDVYGLHAENHSTDQYNNDYSIERLGNALNVITDPATGQPVCSNGGGDGCVPYNIFSDNAVTQEALDYIFADISMSGRVETNVVSGLLSADLEEYGIKLPSASEGVRLALGAEYREESMANFPDELYQFGGAAGFGGGTPKVAAGYNVTEGFVEAAIPIVQDAPGAQDVSLELGFRYSDYSTTGSAETFKTGINWALNHSFRIRGGFNRAVRAPNLWDLFTPTRLGLGGSRDICSGPSPSASPEQCARTGVSAAQYGTILPNPAGQYNTVSGGNVNLDPESADTITFGGVWTPVGIPGLSVAVDYYDIQITETIGSLNADDIVQQCANTGDPTLCNLINRGRFGTLWLQGSFTSTQNNNIGELQAEGVDLNLTHVFTLGSKGYLPITFQGTYTMSSMFTNPLVSYDCVGYFGLQCGPSTPEWRHRVRGTWETNFGLNVSLGWRYLGEVDNDDASSDADIGNPEDLELWRVNGIDKIKAHSWFDVAASYKFSNGIQWTLGINNVFDKEPPLAPDHQDDVELYSTYDPLGRYAFSSFEYRF